MSNGYNNFPINNSRNFKPGKWYPMPTGSMWLDNPDVTYHDSYGIFTLADGESIGGDITAICNDLTLRTAVDICEAHNGESLPIYGVSGE